MWETPVPIPNTTVKTQAADGVGEQVAARLRKKQQTTESAEYRHRHWKVSPVGNRVEPEEI